MLEFADVSLVRPETQESGLDTGKIFNMSDVNSLVGDAASANVLGKNGDYYGVVLWILFAFINH